MTLLDFQKLCGKLNEVRHRVLEEKRLEYTEKNSDVLYNFKQTAEELNSTSMSVAYIFFRKHVASIGQVCADPTMESSEPFEYRIADAMNYLELIYALYCEHSQRNFN